MKYFIVVFVYITSVPILAKRFIEFNEEPTDVFVIRNKPAELRCNITAENIPMISWIKDDVKLDLMNDTRRTILSHGSLYFKSIVRKKKFSPDAGVYRCAGETIVNGISFKILSRKARITVAGMSKSFAKQPQDLTVSVGETAVFKCEIKKSRPAAIITWSKEGKNTDLSLNFRFVVFPSGILEILGVMSSDAGNYICKATNKELGREVTAKAQLTITPASAAAKPSKFLVKPSDVTTLHQENAILECLITGYPKPQVDWYKDGKKITLTQSGHYIKYGASSLKVAAVQPVDSGKYECVMGTDRAAALLQVIVPPQFKVLPTDIEMSEGKDSDFKCEATGYPEPTITWYKNGHLLGEIEHITTTKEGITIMEVLDSDEGIYQCFPRNDGGEIQASAQLIVHGPSTTPPSTTMVATDMTTLLPPILAPSAPKNVNAVASNTTAILVSWQPPDQPHGVIKKYTIVTSRTNTGQVESMLTTQETSLIVTQLKPATLYQFVVYASNEWKEGALSTYVQESTKTAVLSSLGPPRAVSVLAISSMALKVSWRPPYIDPLDMQTVIKNYSIEYRDVDRNTPWHKKSSLKHDVVILKLQPYTKYSVKVAAHSHRGLGQMSDEVFMTTKSGIPKGPPVNIKLFATGDILGAKWSPPSQPNGNITGYVLRLMNDNTGRVSNFTTHSDSKVFMNLEKSATYAFQVAAVTEAGRGEFSEWMRKDTPSKPLTEGEVPGKPTNLRTRVVLGMVQINWDAPNESHIIVRGYVFSYGKMKPADTTEYLPNNVTSYLLRNIQSETVYIIGVRARNRMGQGLEALESVPIPRLKQSSGVVNLRAVPIRRRTIKLSWNDLTISLTPNVGYHVRFENDSKWVEVNVTRRTSLVVQKLRPGMTYTFYVKKKDKINYNTVSNTTREEPPGPPTEVTVSFASEESTVKVHWNYPDESNGKLTNFKICWRPDNDNYNWTCKMVKAYILNDKIANINASLKYSVKILARNRAGEGEFSEPEKFRGDSVRNFGVRSTTTADPPVSTINKTSKTNDTGIRNTVGIKEIDKITGFKADEKTLWIIIAVIAAVTLIAIVIISIVLCKKRLRGTPVMKRRPPPDPYKAVANGNSKKKPSNKENNYWIKQDNMELEPCMKKDDLVVSTIPRNADEMESLDSPFQSRRERGPVDDDDMQSASSDQHPYKHREDYQPLPIIQSKHDNINIHKSPFMPADRDPFPPPPPECVDNNDDEGPATSSDYGSEEIVTTDPGEPDEIVTYMPKNTPNGCVSVAPDYDYPLKHVQETSTLQDLMKDLDAIMAKEDRV